MHNCRAIRRLELPMAAVEEQFRRMVFNLVVRNQDDHTKNIAFLMNKQGEWSLAPAFDLTYACNPKGRWTSTHQMSVNGKRDNFTLEDLNRCAKAAGMKRGRCHGILAEVLDAAHRWREFASVAKLPGEQMESIRREFRLSFPRS